MSEAIQFSALIRKLQTLEGGGWRVTFDVTDIDLAHFARMLPLKDSPVEVMVATERGPAAKVGADSSQ